MAAVFRRDMELCSTVCVGIRQYLPKATLKSRVGLSSEKSFARNDALYRELHIAVKYLQKNRETGISQNRFSSDIGISQRSLGRYIEALETYVANDMLTLHSKRGRPRNLDSMSVESALGSIRSRLSAPYAPSKEDVMSIIMNEAAKTLSRRGVDAVGKECVSRTYFFEFYQKYDLVEAKVQLKTDARIEGKADPRNALSMI